jgi:hypothetical protein
VAGERDEPLKHAVERIAPCAPVPPPRGGIEVRPHGGDRFTVAAEEPGTPAS